MAERIRGCFRRRKIVLNVAEFSDSVSRTGAEVFLRWGIVHGGTVSLRVHAGEEKGVEYSG